MSKESMVQIDTLHAFCISLQENPKWKPLTDPEVAATIREYNELKMKPEREEGPGFAPTLEQYQDADSLHCGKSEGWTQEKTAADWGIFQQAVAKSIQMSIALEEPPSWGSWEVGIKRAPGTPSWLGVARERLCSVLGGPFFFRLGHGKKAPYRRRTFLGWRGIMTKARKNQGPLADRTSRGGPRGRRTIW